MRDEFDCNTPDKNALLKQATEFLEMIEFYQGNDLDSRFDKLKACYDVLSLDESDKAFRKAIAILSAHLNQIKQERKQTIRIQRGSSTFFSPVDRPDAVAVLMQQTWQCIQPKIAVEEADADVCRKYVTPKNFSPVSK